MTPNGVRDKESQYYRMIRVRRGIQLVYSRMMVAHLPERGHVCLRIHDKEYAQKRARGPKVIVPSNNDWRGVSPSLWTRPAIHRPARPARVQDASDRPHNGGDEFPHNLAEAREPSRHFKAGRYLRGVEWKGSNV